MKLKSKKIEQPSTPPIGPIQHASSSVLLDRMKICAMIFLIYLVLSLLHIGCPIKALTGISCPGCGMTRAVISVINMNFGDAYYYHPLFFIAPIMFLLFLFDHLIPPKIKKIIWVVITILFLLVYFYRLIFTKSDVVVIDIWSGVVLNLLHNIMV